MYNLMKSFWNKHQKINFLIQLKIHWQVNKKKGRKTILNTPFHTLILKKWNLVLENTNIPKRNKP